MSQSNVWRVRDESRIIRCFKSVLFLQIFISPENRYIDRYLLIEARGVNDARNGKRMLKEETKKKVYRTCI